MEIICESITWTKLIIPSENRQLDIITSQFKNIYINAVFLLKCLYIVTHIN